MMPEKRPSRSRSRTCIGRPMDLNEAIYVGYGYIKADADGQLALCIYESASTNGNRIGKLSLYESRKSHWKAICTQSSGNARRRLCHDKPSYLLGIHVTKGMGWKKSRCREGGTVGEWTKNQCSLSH
jgi:hypothetical protein